jgi:hypothetical protein
MAHLIKFSFSTATKLAGAAFLFPALVFAQYSSPIRDVENPAHSPLQVSYSVTVPNGAISISNAFVANVPSGKRMVVEYVSVTCGTLAANAVGVATLDLYALNFFGSTPYKLAVTAAPTDGNGINRYYVAQTVRLYADSNPQSASLGGAVTLTAPAQGQFECHFAVSGYTVNMP